MPEQKQTSDTLRVLMKIAQCEERKESANGSLPLVNEVSASCAGVFLHLCGTASSPLDTSFAMHPTLKGLICLQV